MNVVCSRTIRSWDLREICVQSCPGACGTVRSSVGGRGERCVVVLNEQTGGVKRCRSHTIRSWELCGMCIESRPGACGGVCSPAGGRGGRCVVVLNEQVGGVKIGRSCAGWCEKCVVDDPRVCAEACLIVGGRGGRCVGILNEYVGGVKRCRSHSRWPRNGRARAAVGSHCGAGGSWGPWCSAKVACGCVLKRSVAGIKGPRSLRAERPSEAGGGSGVVGGSEGGAGAAR